MTKPDGRDYTPLPSCRFNFVHLSNFAALDSAASSLDQDAYGHVFYADFVDLLLLRPSPSSRGRIYAGKRRATSAEPHTDGIMHGIYHDGNVGDKHDDGDWGPSRTYPGASSRSNSRGRQVSDTGLYVGNNSSYRKDGPSPSGDRAAYSDGYGSNNDNRFVGKRQTKRANPIPVSHGGGRVGDRAKGTSSSSSSAAATREGNVRGVNRCQQQAISHPRSVGTITVREKNHMQRRRLLSSQVQVQVPCPTPEHLLLSVDR